MTAGSQEGVHAIGRQVQGGGSPTRKHRGDRAKERGEGALWESTRVHAGASLGGLVRRVSRLRPGQHESFPQALGHSTVPAVWCGALGWQGQLESGLECEDTEGGGRAPDWLVGIREEPMVCCWPSAVAGEPWKPERQNVDDKGVWHPPAARNPVLFLGPLMQTGHTRAHTG